MHAPERTALHLRRYALDGHSHAHPHVQVVVPLQGGMDMEIDGRGGRIGDGRLAFVAPGAAHAQSAHGPNRFLVIDCAVEALGEARIDQLRRRAFQPHPPALRRLGEFIARGSATGAVPDALARHCLPLLLQALAGTRPALARLQPLCDRIEASLGEAWPVERMARLAGLGTGRLHALFRREFDQTPQQWLTGQRLDTARRRLLETDQPIARIALDSGYSDQTALTRALRRETGLTPGAWRRRHRPGTAS